MDLLNALKWRPAGSRLVAETEQLFAKAAQNMFHRRHILVKAAAIAVEELSGKDFAAPSHPSEESEQVAWMLLSAAAGRVRSGHDRDSFIAKVCTEAANAVAARMSVSLDREDPSPFRFAEVDLQDPEIAPAFVSVGDITKAKSPPATAPNAADEHPLKPATPDPQPVKQVEPEKRQRFKKCHGCGLRETNCVCHGILASTTGKELVQRVKASLEREQVQSEAEKEQESKPSKILLPKPEPKPAKVESKTMKPKLKKQVTPAESSTSDEESSVCSDDSVVSKHHPNLVEGRDSAYAHFWQDPARLQEPLSWLEAIWSEGHMNMQAYQMWLSAMQQYWGWKMTPTKPSERLTNALLFNLQMWVIHVPDPSEPSESVLTWATMNVDNLMIQRAFDKGDKDAAQVFSARLQSQEQSERYKSLWDKFEKESKKAKPTPKTTRNRKSKREEKKESKDKDKEKK